MLILWTILITAISAQKVFESSEDIEPEAFQNITTLYPVPHNTTSNKTRENLKEDQLTEVDKDPGVNKTNSKEDKSKIDATIWKIEAAFAESNLENNDEKENITKEIADKKNETKEFKPSQHLGNFYDEDNFHVTPSKASSESFTPLMKPAGFVSTTDDFRSPVTKIPKQILQTHIPYPYKFESPILARHKDPWSPDSLDSKPTIESPVRIPAGGFYKYEDPFREKPGYPEKSYDELFKEKPLFPQKDEDLFKEKPGSSEEFGLSFTEDGKTGDNAIKKRVNPWEHFLRLVTAFLPVGLIISALTPSLITIENTGPGPQGHTYPSNGFRRSEAVSPELAAISERCRRRLLCELHSDYYYNTNNSPVRRGKHCYKIHCEDTEALERTLRWLLEYRRTHSGHNN